MISIIQMLTKKYKLRKVSAAITVVNIILVYANNKRSYLLDTCSMTKEEAYAILKLIFDVLGLDQNKMHVVSLMDDIFYINTTDFIQSLHTLYQGVSGLVYSGDGYPILIDLDAERNYELYSLNNQDKLSLKSLTTRIIDDITTGCNCSAITADTPAYLQLGGPALAGIFLGYPVIYLARPSHISQGSNGTTSDHASQFVGQYQAASEKLSFTQLTKITCQLLIDYQQSHKEMQSLLDFLPKECCHNNNSNSSSKKGSRICRWSSLEFTYPCQLSTSEEQDRMLFAVDYFKHTMRDRDNSKQVDGRECNNDILHIDGVNLLQEVITTGAISL